MKTYGGADVSSTILNLSSGWRSLVSFTLWQLYPWRKSPGTLWLGGWMSPRARLDSTEKGRMSLLPGIEPQPPAPSPSIWAKE
jgi:hypothetical protein